MKILLNILTEVPRYIFFAIFGRLNYKPLLLSESIDESSKMFKDMSVVNILQP